MKIAVIGSGISGLTAAMVLSDHHEVTLFEADDRLGGHANTFVVKEDEGEFHVDTGFLVYNEATYPLFIALLHRLGVPTKASSMSFSYTDASQNLEWKGSSLNTVFAQRRNILRPRFVRMVIDIVRFNRTLRRLLRGEIAPELTLGDVLATHSWCREFEEWYLVPMGAAIWSANPRTFATMPARTFAEFFARHGLFNVRRAPAWRTIEGGSHEYVRRIGEYVAQRGTVRLATPVRQLRRHDESVEVVTDEQTHSFDHVVVACHSNDALALLSDPTPQEVDVLGSIHFQSNKVTLHWDTLLLPSSNRTWAAWNYRRSSENDLVATLTYNVSTLQSIEGPREYLVSLNSENLIEPAKILQRFIYDHPVLDHVTVRAQQLRHTVNRGRTSFCGAYFGYGFHEDGVRSALEVCAALGVQW